MNLLEEVRAARTLPPPEAARAIRERAFVSQDRLARELGVHRITLARWEAGTHAPRGTARQRYARLLAELDAVVRAA